MSGQAAQRCRRQARPTEAPAGYLGSLARVCCGAMPQPISPNPLRRGLVEERASDACAVVIFGASGDLTRRKLMPALYNLAWARSLPGAFAVVGVARRDKNDESFRGEMREAVASFLRRK